MPAFQEFNNCKDALPVHNVASKYETVGRFTDKSMRGSWLRGRAMLTYNTIHLVMNSVQVKLSERKRARGSQN